VTAPASTVGLPSARASSLRGDLRVATVAGVASSLGALLQVLVSGGPASHAGIGIATVQQSLVVAVFAMALTALSWRSAVGPRPGRVLVDALLLTGPTTLAGSVFLVEGVVLAHGSLVLAVAGALALGAAVGCGVAWVARLAEVSRALAAEGRVPRTNVARAAYVGIGGLAVLVLGLAAIRNIEKTERAEDLQALPGLLVRAGELALEPVELAVPDESARPPAVLLVEASSWLARGHAFDADLQAWMGDANVAEPDALFAALARAAASRERMVGVLAELAASPGGQAGRSTADPLQQPARSAIDAHRAVQRALARLLDDAQRDLARRVMPGFLLLALVTICAGMATARAISRLVRAQDRAMRGRVADLERLADVVRQSTNLAVVTDAAGRIEWVNPSFESLTGWTLDEVRGRSPGSVLQFEGTDPDTVAEIDAALRAERPVRVEIQNRARDGRRFWIDLAIQPRHSELGVLRGFVSIASDVTETRRLRLLQREFFETMPAGVVVQDADGRVVDFNVAACALLGLDVEQLMGRRSVDAGWGAIREDGTPFPGEEHYAMATLRTGEQVDSGVMGILTPQGERRWLEVSTRLVPMADGGRPHVMACFTDLTPRKRAEDELAHQKARLAAALDGTHAGAWHWRVDEGLLHVDARWAEIVDGTAMRGDTLPIGEWMRLLHPDDAVLAREVASMYLAGITDRYDAELRVRHADGHWIWVHCRGRLAGGTGARAMFGTLMDISARKQASAAASAEQSKLKRLFELAPVGIALVDGRDGAILDCNRALCDLLGRRHEDVLRTTLSALEGPVDGHAPPPPVDGTGAQPRERHYLRADGSRVPALVYTQRFALADGEEASWVIVQDLSERKAMEDGLQREARTDKLTALANRAALVERLDAMVARARVDGRAGFCVLFLDFDRFKLVNDSLGHEAGDDLLRQIAGRLTRALRGAGSGPDARSFVARIGGDEFVVLVGGTTDLAEADGVARRLLRALAAPYSIRGLDVQSSASIGVVSSRQGELDASAILRNADTAMYEAKRRGRGISVVFDDGMRARLQRQVDIERQLRRAIGAGELAVAYQPIVDLDSGALSSVEALVRWRSAELGEVSPSEFIPIAEDCGVVVDVGEWVLETACREFSAWIGAHPASRATISVNLSRIQMSQPERLLTAIERVLGRSGLSPQRLQLEVTERDVMRDPAAVLVLIRQIRALGVRLAMDDFGTGTSSLACLRDYPFDVIKIDRAFVGDLGRDAQVMALVHATMMLIENLGMVSVAEGVESAPQVAILQSVGCRLGQGWHFGQPGPLEALRDDSRSAA
jgi:diguanylate cyclase (GGDEF)-like protein/PAS domain S-box-containing protein